MCGPSIRRTRALPISGSAGWRRSRISGCSSSIAMESKTGNCGKRFASVAGKTGKRLQVFPVTEGHCAVPVRRLPKLLNPVSTSAKPKAKKELEDEGFGQEEFEQEEFEQEEFELEEEAPRDDPEAESAEYDTDEAEGDAQEGAAWESLADEPLESAGEELEADEADYERDQDSEIGEAEDEHEDDDKP